jgi:hypothetical protein
MMRVSGELESSLGEAVRRVGGVRGKIVTIPLCIERLMVTDGTTTARDELLDCGPVAHLGPQIEQWRLVFEGNDFGTEFRVRFTWRWSASGLRWSSPQELLGFQASADQLIGSWVSTPTAMGPLLRLFAETKNNQAGAASSGRVSAWLDAQLKT